MRTVTIHQLAGRLGVTPRSIRFYEEQGLVTAERNLQNARCYDPAAQQRLELISSLRRAGLSLKDIREFFLLQTRADAASNFMARKLAAMSDEVAERQQAIEALSQAFIERPETPLRAANAS